MPFLKMYYYFHNVIMIKILDRNDFGFWRRCLVHREKTVFQCRVAIVVLCNVKERQGEPILLRALGFNRRILQKMVLSGHLMLLVAGILCGIAATGVGTLPFILTLAQKVLTLR